MNAHCARSVEHGHARSRRVPGSRRTSIRKSSRDHRREPKGREVIRFLKPLTVNLLGPCQEIFPPRKAAEMLPAPCEEANSVESCTVTALDAITAFAVPNPNCPSGAVGFLRVWSFNRLPCRTDHPVYFGLVKISFSQPFCSGLFFRNHSR